VENCRQGNAALSIIEYGSLQGNRRGAGEHEISGNSQRWIKKKKVLIRRKHETVKVSEEIIRIRP